MSEHGPIDARVLLISREYPPFVGGGIGTYTVRMARALAGQGRSPVVVTVGDCDAPVVEEDGGVRIVRLPFLDHLDGQPDWAAPRASILASPTGRACHAAFWAFHRESVLAMQLREHLPWLAETFEPTAIEAPDTGALLWFVLNERRLGRGPLAERGQDGPPVIVHLHSPTAWIEELQGGPQPGRAMAELRSMERDVLRWADGVACPSHALAQWTTAWEPAIEGKVCVTPYPLGGVDDPGPREGNSIDTLFVGRMERRKGFDTLAQAAGLLGGQCPMIRVAGRDTFDWVAGEHFGVAAMGRHGVRFELLGELEPAVLAEQRRACGIAVIPSPNDNYPNTCMEAMAAGQLVIASRAGGMAEMVEDGVSGLLFTPGDAADLARGMERACSMSAEERRAMGQATRARIEAICGDAAVVTRRLEHARGLSVVTPRANADRQVAVVTFAGIDDGVRDALTAALRANTEIDAVAPWFERMGPDGPEIIPFSTPRRGCEGLLVEHPGPIAIDASWLERLEQAGVHGNASSILRGLVDLGANVAVATEVLARSPDHRADAPGTPMPQQLTDAERSLAAANAACRAAEQAAEMARQERDQAHAALADIRASRAYKLAERLSRLRRRLLG
ncbi:MAG: glycosyltransferase family 4 protein [Phycisphaerales bacterium]